MQSMHHDVISISARWLVGLLVGWLIFSRTYLLTPILFHFTFSNNNNNNNPGVANDTHHRAAFKH
jgi:hypothetical protein